MSYYIQGQECVYIEFLVNISFQERKKLREKHEKKLENEKMCFYTNNRAKQHFPIKATCIEKDVTSTWLNTRY